MQAESPDRSERLIKLDSGVRKRLSTAKWHSEHRNLLGDTENRSSKNSSSTGTKIANLGTVKERNGDRSPSKGQSSSPARRGAAHGLIHDTGLLTKLQTQVRYEQQKRELELSLESCTKGASAEGRDQQQQGQPRGETTTQSRPQMKNLVPSFGQQPTPAMLAGAQPSSTPTHETPALDAERGGGAVEARSSQRALKLQSATEYIPGTTLLYGSGVVLQASAHGGFLRFDTKRQCNASAIGIAPNSCFTIWNLNDLTDKGSVRYGDAVWLQTAQQEVLGSRLVAKTCVPEQYATAPEIVAGRVCLLESVNCRRGNIGKARVAGRWIILSFNDPMGTLGNTVCHKDAIALEQEWGAVSSRKRDSAFVVSVGGFENVQDVRQDRTREQVPAFPRETSWTIHLTELPVDAAAEDLGHRSVVLAREQLDISKETREQRGDIPVKARRELRRSVQRLGSTIRMSGVRHLNASVANRANGKRMVRKSLHRLDPQNRDHWLADVYGRDSFWSKKIQEEYKRATYTRRSSLRDNMVTNRRQATEAEYLTYTLESAVKAQVWEAFSHVNIERHRLVQTERRIRATTILLRAFKRFQSRKWKKRLGELDQKQQDKFELQRFHQQLEESTKKKKNQQAFDLARKQGPSQQELVEQRKAKKAEAARRRWNRSATMSTLLPSAGNGAGLQSSASNGSEQGHTTDEDRKGETNEKMTNGNDNREVTSPAGAMAARFGHLPARKSDQDDGKSLVRQSSSPSATQRGNTLLSLLNETNRGGSGENALAKATAISGFPIANKRFLVPPTTANSPDAPAEVCADEQETRGAAVDRQVDIVIQSRRASVEQALTRAHTAGPSRTRPVDAKSTGYSSLHALLVARRESRAAAEGRERAESDASLTPVDKPVNMASGLRDEAGYLQLQSDNKRGSALSNTSEASTHARSGTVTATATVSTAPSPSRLRRRSSGNAPENSASVGVKTSAVVEHDTQRQSKRPLTSTQAIEQRRHSATHPVRPSTAELLRPHSTDVGPAARESRRPLTSRVPRDSQQQRRSRPASAFLGQSLRRRSGVNGVNTTRSNGDGLGEGDSDDWVEATARSQAQLWVREPPPAVMMPEIGYTARPATAPVLETMMSSDSAKAAEKAPRNASFYVGPRPPQENSDDDDADMLVAIAAAAKMSQKVAQDTAKVEAAEADAAAAVGDWNTADAHSARVNAAQNIEAHAMLTAPMRRVVAVRKTMAHQVQRAKDWEAYAENAHVHALPRALQVEPSPRLLTGDTVDLNRSPTATGVPSAVVGGGGGGGGAAAATTTTAAPTGPRAMSPPVGGGPPDRVAAALAPGSGFPQSPTASQSTRGRMISGVSMARPDKEKIKAARIVQESAPSPGKVRKSWNAFLQKVEAEAVMHSLAAEVALTGGIDVAFDMDDVMPVTALSRVQSLEYLKTLRPEKYGDLVAHRRQHSRRQQQR